MSSLWARQTPEYWREYLGPNIPMYRMPYAVDNDYFSRLTADAAPHRETLRRELDLEPGRPIFLFASKLQTRKRCIDLVDAFLKLSPAPGIDPPAYLLLIGDGEERAAIEQRIRESGLSGIRMLGFKNQSELPRFFVSVRCIHSSFDSRTLGPHRERSNERRPRCSRLR